MTCDLVEINGASYNLDNYLWTMGLCRAESMKDCTIDNFETNGNQALVQRKQLAEWFVSDSRSSDMMIFFGHTGRGKTHLALGIMREWAKSGRAVIYWPLMQLLAHLRKMMNDNRQKPDQYIDFLVNFPGLLIIDELGRSKGDTWDRDSLIYPLLDQRQNMPTLAISNFNFKELANIYDGAIASRLKSGKIVSWPGNLIEDQREARRV